MDDHTRFATDARVLRSWLFILLFHFNYLFLHFTISFSSISGIQLLAEISVSSPIKTKFPEPSERHLLRGPGTVVVSRPNTLRLFRSALLRVWHLSPKRGGAEKNVSGRSRMGARFNVPYPQCQRWCPKRRAPLLDGVLRTARPRVPLLRWNDE